MIKRILNRSKDYLTLLPWIEKHLIQSMKGKISCLLYHRIEEYGNHQFLDLGGSPVTSQNDFNRELDYLKQLPCEFYTLSELNSGRYPDANTIGLVICFDDCFMCNYQHGSEVLNKHKIPAVFFQSTSLINRNTLLWEHALYWLLHDTQTRGHFVQQLRNALDLDSVTDEILISYLINNVSATQIQELATESINHFSLDKKEQTLSRSIYPDEYQLINANKKGHEIASHGHNHFKRSQINEQDFKLEITRSQQLLGQITGIQPVSFSYPFNSYLPTDHELVGKYYKNIATVDGNRIHKPINEQINIVPRYTWPGRYSNLFRMKRWLLTGSY